MPAKLRADGARSRLLHTATVRRLERLFGADLRRLRVRERRLAPGIAALASGDTVWVAPGFYRPGTARGDALLAHEVAHLLQQRRRLADAGAKAAWPALLVDPALECEADVWACLALCPPSTAGALRAPRGGRLARGRASVAQPWILMARGTGDDPAQYGSSDYAPRLQFGKDYFRAPDDNRGKPHDDRFDLLTSVSTAMLNVGKAYRFLFGTRPPPRVYDLLVTWMGAVHSNRVDAKHLLGNVVNPYLGNEGMAMKVRGEAGVRGEMRYYHTYGELAYALHQEIGIHDALADEANVARTVLRSTGVAALLTSLGDKVVAHALQNADKIATALASKATYGPLHGRKTLGDVLEALGKHQETDVGGLVALLHDAKDLYAQSKLIQGGEPGFQLTVQQQVPVNAVDGTPRAKTLDVSKYDSRYNVGTPDESDAWVAWMRENQRPVWAGPSYTMMHMWKMATAAGGTALELEALGYAMFAYWNGDRYPLTSTPVHRFHETLAAAREFKVPYNPDASASVNHAGLLGRIAHSPDIPRDTLVARSSL